MNRIFSLDNPVMAFMGKVADLIILNFIAIIFSIPIFTIGASWTAMYYVTLKMVRKEESYMFKDFWHSFKENFKQATIIWLLVLLVVAIFVGDFFIIRMMPDMIPKALMIVLAIMAFIISCTIIFVFPVLSHFENTIKNTIKNAFIISLINIPYTILFIILFVLPFILFFYFYQVLPAVVMLGFSAPAYFASLFWDRIFRKIEPKVESDEIEEAEEVE